MTTFYSGISIGSSSVTQPTVIFKMRVEEDKSRSVSNGKKEDLLNIIEGYWRENTSGISENFSVPVKFETYVHAKDFIAMLPLDSLPSEVVAVSGRGHIGFDWINPDGRSLTIVINETTAYFAALLNNGERFKGSLNLPFKKIPRQIIDAIGSTFE